MRTLLVVIVIIAIVAVVGFLGYRTVVSYLDTNTTQQSTATPGATAAPVAKATDAPTVVPDTNTNWPTTAEQAAKLFGGTADRWKLTPDGGWQLREEDFRTMIVPSGFTAEGYYDQNPGKDPYQVVFTTLFEVQGCTVWPLPPARANELFDEMAKQKGYTTEQADRLINKLGWE